MKTDARVKYTKMVLKKALLELMQHKPVNKITVKEICERAELNRATFYAHYSDCFDLLPLTELSDAHKELLEKALKDYGVL